MKILLGIGGGPDGFRALSTMLDRVQETGDALTIMIVDNPNVELSLEEIDQQVHQQLADMAMDIPVRVESGDPGSRLLEIAEAEGFDAIAIGGGEESPMGKISLGSMTEFIVLNAGVTVMLIR